MKTNTSSLRCLLAVVALTLALPAFTETRPFPPKASDWVGAWTGYSDHSDFVRLEFDPDGTGYVSIMWSGDTPPDVYRVTRWRPSGESVEAEVVPVTKVREAITFQSIKYGSRSIHCEFGAAQWRHHARLWGERAWLARTKQAQESIAKAKVKQK